MRVLFVPVVFSLMHALVGCTASSLTAEKPNMTKTQTYGCFVGITPNSNNAAIYEICDFVAVRRMIPLGQVGSTTGFVSEAMAIDSISPAYDPNETYALIAKVLGYPSLSDAKSQLNRRASEGQVFAGVVEMTQPLLGGSISFLPAAQLLKSLSTP